MTSPNPLEEILEEDYHRALLETGNLSNLSRGSHQWTGKDCWLAEGFVAKVHAQACAGCKAVTFQLLGIFRIESNAARKASRFTPIKPGEPLPSRDNVPDALSAHPLEISIETLPHCTECLTKLGFPPVMKAFQALGE